MSDFGDDDVEDFFDEGVADWLYVEDTWDEAFINNLTENSVKDELAEQTCPSPPAQTLVPDEDVDPYEYFIDLDYLSDGYYDHRADRNVRKEARRKLHERRKQAKAGSRKSTNRPHRGHHVPLETLRNSEVPPVMWVPQRKRCLGPDSYAPITDVANLQVVTLFKDWHERFSATKGFSFNKGTAKDPDALLNERQDNMSRESNCQHRLPEEAPSLQDAEEPASGAARDDLKGVAELLTEENLEQIQALLKARGIDPEALETVLGDLMEGREPDFDGDENAEEEEEEDISESEQSHFARSTQRRTQPIIDEGATTGKATAEPLAQPKRKRNATLMQLDDAIDNENEQSEEALHRPPSKKGRIEVKNPAKPVVAPARPDANGDPSKRRMKRKADAVNGVEKSEPKRMKAGGNSVDTTTAAEASTTGSTRSRRK